MNSGPDEARSPLPSLGRCPLFLVFLGTALGILAVQQGLTAPLVVLVLWATWFGFRTRKPPFIAGAGAALLMANWHHARLEERDELLTLLKRSPEAELRGTLVESNSSGLIQQRFRTESGGQVNLVGLPHTFKTGQKLIVTGRPLLQETPRNPVGWQSDKIVYQRGIAGTVAVTSAQATGWSLGIPLYRGWAEDLRRQLVQRLTIGIHDPSARDLIKGVILGERTQGSRVFDGFRQTGTQHIFAVSGLHVGLVALILYWVGRLLRVPPRVLFWFTIFAMFGYAWITGLRPPALRASIMGALVLGRFLLLRRPAVFNNLFAAGLIVLATDSFQLGQAGFQLSFAVVAIILLLEPHLWTRVGPFLEHDPFLPKSLWTRLQKATFWLKNKLGRMFTVSVAAWGGSAPLSLLQFGWFTPIAALASVWIIVLAFFILSLAFVSLLFGTLIPPLTQPINSLNGQVALVAKNSVDGMGRWPGAWNQFLPATPWQDGLCVFDVRYGGAAIHLDAGGGTFIDAGHEVSFWRVVEPALRAHGLRCDTLIASHDDSTHIQGLRSALHRFSIKQALVPPPPYRESLSALTASCQAKGVKVFSAQSGQSFAIDDQTRIEVIYPGNRQQGRADDRGLVVKIHLDGWRILITGDAGYATEQALLQNGADLASDVWICGRNTRDTVGQDAFVNAINPRAIIATDTAHLEGEQVPESWRKWLESKGIEFFSQREEGAVFVVPKTRTLNLESFLTNRTVVLKR